MVKITREDLLKLAKISAMSITEDEIPPLVEKLEAVLGYASYLQEIAAQQKGAAMPKNINVMREDVVIPTPSEPLLALAPSREENFYVVPIILKSED